MKKYTEENIEGNSEPGQPHQIRQYLEITLVNLSCNRPVQLIGDVMLRAP